MAGKLLAQVNIGEAFQIGNEGICPGGVEDCGRSGYESIGAFVSTLLPNVYIIAGIILFFLFIFGGFSIITAGGNPDKAKQGQQALTSAIIGFVLVFASYWIIQIIEVLTGLELLGR